ncbi:hypothetical protein [Cryobacterium sp. AP23]
MRINDGSVVAESQRDGDPEARLRALQRRAFAADGDAAGDREVARAIRELQAEIAAATGGAQSRPVASEPVRMPPGASAIGSPPLPDAPGDPPEPPAEPPAEPGSAAAEVPSRRWGLLVAGVAGAVALGALAGSAVTAAIHTEQSASVSGAGETKVPATDDPAPNADQPVLVGEIFTRGQTPRDIPLVPMPETFAAESFRYLGSAGWTDADADGVTDSPYYAARGASGIVCLVVVPEESGYLSTCALESAYPEAGLRLSWQSVDLHPALRDSGDIVLDISVTWLSNAMVETRGSGRPVVVP